MIYTCYDMIRDCRADRPQGWSYFVTNYLPAMRSFIAHYFPERDHTALIERVLLALRNPESGLFRSLDPVPERAFVSELRQHVLAAVEGDRAGEEPEIGLDLETLSGALSELTMVEKQVVWFETMRYEKPDVAAMLKMSPETVEKIRVKASELIRGKVDRWRRSLIQDNGAQLGRAAAALKSESCLPAKALLDVIDGRSNWYSRDEMDRHIAGCWYCIDNFCRLREVCEILRHSAPLTEPEAWRFLTLLGLKPQKASGWKRLFAAGKSQ